MRGLVLGLGFSGPAIIQSLLPQTEDLIDRMSVAPDGERIMLINALIASQVKSGSWQLKDALYVTAAHDSQAATLNWIQGTYNLTDPGTTAPAFTVNRGFTGDGASDYLSTGFNPATAGGQFTMDDCHMAFWHATAFAGANRALGGNRTDRILQGSASIAAIGSNNASVVNRTVTANGKGYNGYSRSNSEDVEFLHSGESIATLTLASSTVQNSTFLLLAYNNGGTPAGFTDARVEAMSFGAALSPAQMIADEAALAAYMAGVGL